MSSDDARARQLDALRIALAGSWSLERELGRGGMATVYLARDVALERPVAIKVLDPDLNADPEQRARFVREARTGARLTHPHIVPIYAVEEAGDAVFIVMGLVDGESLAQRIHRAGPLSSEDTMRLLREVGQAIGYAHAMGTLHRDITLDNILIERRTGRAMLVDFGIAGEINREEAGPLLGTPAYLAPELIQGDPATPASDLYALGITAWAMLAGRLPFHGEDVGAVLLQQLTAPLPSLSDAAPGASATLIRAIENCLHKEPAARPSTAERWLESVAAKALTAPVTGPLDRWVHQWNQVKGFYALGLSLLAIGGIGALADTAAIYLGMRSALFFQIKIAILCFGTVLVVHRLVALRLLRAVVRSGYGIEDIQVALRSRPSRAPVTDSPAAGGTIHTVLGRATWAAGLGYFFILVLLFEPWYQHSDFVIRGFRPTPILVWIAAGARWSYLAFIVGLSARLLATSPTTRLEGPLARLRRLYWTSSFGRVSLRIAGFGLRRVAAAPEETLHRPTELMLDLAIEDLWRALPRSHRTRLAELPKLARALRQRVGKVRDIRQDLEAMDLRQSREKMAACEELTSRQAAGVMALERLRLLLLRMNAATLSMDEMTLPLALAREADRELLDALGAHRDLAKRISARTTSLTPAPTPA